MKAHNYMLPIALLALLTACKKETDVEKPVEPAVETAPAEAILTLQANKGEADTKALDLVNDGKTLNAYWKDTEKVKVFKDGTLLGTLDVTPAAGEKPTSATLSGPVTTEGLAANDVLMLMIPGENWNYAGQVGTLESIETTYDYATASVTIATVDDENHTITTTASANFQNQQSIYRFGFKDGENYFDPKDFTVSATGGKLVQSMSWNGSAWTPLYGNIGVTPASAPGDHFYYVSIRNDQTTDDTYSFVITGSDDALYMASKGIPGTVLDVPGKFISAKNITATKPDFAPAGGTTDTAL